MVDMVEPADPSLMSWVQDRAAESGEAGFAASGWEASVWILHRMWEFLGVVEESAWDEQKQKRVKPEVVGTADVDALVTIDGTPLDGRQRADPEWKRLSWARWPGISIEHPYPPGVRWFETERWPVPVVGAEEGSMERADLRDLIDVLSLHSSAGRETPCLCYFAPLLSMNFDRTDLRSATLDEILDLYGLEEQSPSNFWPDDRSWFVYTDYDCDGTKVSGTQALISDLIGDDRLETVVGPW